MRNIDYDVSDRYRSASATLSLHGIDTTASEAHGIVCGLIIASGHYVADDNTQAIDRVSAPFLAQWTRVITGETQQPNIADPVFDLVAEMYSQLSQGLISDDYTLQLLLPGDTDTLADRGQALIAWCQGLLLGLLREHNVEIRALPNDVPEIVSDIMAIAESELSDDDDDEDNDSERALMELEEYVRVGVRVVFEELVIAAADLTSGRKPSDQLH